jgi:hypothetical protein
LNIQPSFTYFHTPYRLTISKQFFFYLVLKKKFGNEIKRDLRNQVRAWRYYEFTMNLAGRCVGIMNSQCNLS